jgi:hypothetical protein
MPINLKQPVAGSLQVVGLAVLSLLGLPATANDFMDFVIGSGYEENLPRGLLEKDIHSSEFLNASFTAGRLYQPWTNTSVVISASAGWHSFFNQHGYDFGSLDLGLSVQHKLGMGPYTPRVAFNIGAGREASRGAERDRDIYRYELSLSRRFNAVMGFAMGYSVEISRGLEEPDVDFDALPYLPGFTKPTDPMDYTNRSLFGGLDYALENGWLLSASYRYLDGYVISSAVPPVVDLFRFTEAVALDPAYDRLRLMYLMETTADMWSTALSIPIDNDTSVDIGYHWQDFEVRYVGGYDNAQFSVSLVHQF